MKSLFKTLDSIAKISIILSFFLTPSLSFAKINAKQWVKVCEKDNKNCFIGATFEQTLGNEEKRTLATAYIKLASTTERKMNRVDGEEKTYKLIEEKKSIPVLFINFPLNVDLTNPPLIKINEKNITTMNFSNCNKIAGCVSSSALNNEAIKLFKSGKILKVLFRIHGSNKNRGIDFTLKGFTKSYERLTR